jgi:hypothetical protein
MAVRIRRTCETCGQNLPLFSSKRVCDKCASEQAAKLAQIEQGIIGGKVATREQLDFLAGLEHSQKVACYRHILSGFLEDAELEDAEIDALNTLREGLGLTLEEAQFVDVVLPYSYARAIREEGHLPSVRLDFQGADGVVLRKGELVHAYCPVVYKELRSVVTGYSGGSHGVSIRVMKGVRYHVGTHRGHVIREDRLQEVSRGVLILTNQRLFLHPARGASRTVSIPRAKIQSYTCYENAIEVFKEGREKGYYFVSRPGYVEVLALCLGHLLQS